MSAPIPHQLARRLGTGDAVVVGLSAMVGAGVFAVFAPAAQAAGSGLLVGLGLAAVVAFCNATSSAQLAAAYPTSGGTYVYGREVLGPWWGFVAGWGFVVGKTASCAAMALTFATYAVPAGRGWQRIVGAGAVVLLTVANLRGITRTAAAARVLLVATGAVLVGFLALAATGAADVHPSALPVHGGVGGVLQSAGLIFFAFAGYARIATLAEEVRRPEQLGRAIVIALAVVVLLYLAVGLALVAVLGRDLPSSATPVASAVDALGAAWAVPVVRIGAAAASLGALLALLAGVGRTTLAMARERDLPGPLASVDLRHHVPDRAQLAIGAVVVVLVLTSDLRGVIGFSSCGVLIYYAVANLSAVRQPAAQRRWPRALQLVGLVGCLVLVVTLPSASVLAGLGVLAVGVLGRLVVLRHRR
ncbi:APC family permease [Angustibacter sp. Root456]|uniref:APC family permease n=1 Tax=Angustibacter sp. Root456 TaxID=1736539 RepID=UPI0006F21AE5|nr:APC family permease [Angustibacter sp. Root456]KQX69953.1 transporter [Angustibacter sp. Root456]